VPLGQSDHAETTVARYAITAAAVPNATRGASLTAATPLAGEGLEEIHPLSLNESSAGELREVSDLRRCEATTRVTVRGHASPPYGWSEKCLEMADGRPRARPAPVHPMTSAPRPGRGSSGRSRNWLVEIIGGHRLASTPAAPRKGLHRPSPKSPTARGAAPGAPSPFRPHRGRESPRERKHPWLGASKASRRRRAGRP